MKKFNEFNSSTNEALSGSERAEAAKKYQKISGAVYDLIMEVDKEEKNEKDVEMAIEAVKIGIEWAKDELKIN